MLATDPLRDIVLPRLDRIKKSGAGFMAQCPAHEDGTASLSVAAGSTHPVVFHCQAGCTPDAVLDKLGLSWADLSKPREQAQRGADEWTPAGPAVAVYDYRDEQGSLLFQVCRTAAKDFRQRVPDPAAKGGYRWQLGDTRRVLYKLPKVLAAVDECRTVYLVEGEKDVHTLEGQGLIATCNPGGAGKWKAEYSEALRDAVVVIIADKDAPGQAHARLVRDALAGIADSVTIVESAHGKDATDHFTAGGTLDTLETTWTSEPAAKPQLAIDLWEFLAEPDSDNDWIVPGLFERGDRLILTGFEGLGKSMLNRQLAIAIAAGVHPFKHGTRFPARRVLYIDCENSEAQSRRKLRPIAEVTRFLDSRVPDGGMRLIHRSGGIDLTRAEDAAWLLERVTAHQPDALFIGPLYKLCDDNLGDEQVAKRILTVLDKARAISDCILVTEAHAGHGDHGKDRSVRPIGSSILLRWPEFGFGIAPNGLSGINEKNRCTEVDVKHWRGARDDRDWPTHLRYGKTGHMPWESFTPAPPPPKGAKP